MWKKIFSIFILLSLTAASGSPTISKSEFLSDDDILLEDSLNQAGVHHSPSQSSINDDKVSADLEGLLHELAAKGYPELMDRIARGELIVDDDKMATLKKYIAGHDKVFGGGGAEGAGVGEKSKMMKGEAHMEKIHSVLEFDRDSALANLTALIGFLTSELDGNGAKGPGIPDTMDVDEEVRRFFTLDPAGLSKGLSKEEAKRIEAQVDSLHQLLNRRHKGDIEELERLEAEYEKMLAEQQKWDGGDLWEEKDVVDDSSRQKTEL